MPKAATSQYHQRTKPLGAYEGKRGARCESASSHTEDALSAGSRARGSRGARFAAKIGLQATRHAPLEVAKSSNGLTSKGLGVSGAVGCRHCARFGRSKGSSRGVSVPRRGRGVLVRALQGGARSQFGIRNRVPCTQSDGARAMISRCRYRIPGGLESAWSAP